VTATPRQSALNTLFSLPQYKSINYQDNPVESPEDWMGAAETPLSGFSWRSGSARDTTGIVIWNDVFLYEVPSTGERLAILVMDTQGLFDNKTSAMDNSRIFALGSLISSIQVLNLSGVVQEDQLQYLQFATEFAKFAIADNIEAAGKPFQNLMFLIRDWVSSFLCTVQRRSLTLMLLSSPGQSR
jgi:atlastin